MVEPWHIYLLLPLCLPVSPIALASTGENAKETKQMDRLGQFLTHTIYKLPKSGVEQGDPSLGPEKVLFLSQPLSWSSSSSEDMDRQGVIGEYSDLQDNTETSLSYDGERGLISRPTTSVTEDATPTESVQTLRSSSESALQKLSQGQTFNYQSTERSTVSVVQSTQSKDRDLSLKTLQNETTDSHFPFILSGSLSSHKSDQSSTPLLSAGPEADPEDSTSPVKWGWTSGIPVSTQGYQDERSDIRNHNLQRGVVSREAAEDDFKKHNLLASEVSGRVLIGNNMKVSTTTCETSAQPWTLAYPEDFTLSESLQPSLPVSPALIIPLYSDWNSAFATWGFAWEAHIYGLGSIFAIFGLISAICLLVLPFRCPPGSLYFTMLHFFILAFAGIQAFSLLYDAYSSQERLPPLATLFLSELPLPCLISAFSLAFLLLSLRSRKLLSIPFPFSTLFSILPKPCLLLCMSLLHFIISLGCVGLLQFFLHLPLVILLLPQGLFVCVSVFLAFSYLIFSCLTQLNTKHVYRLSDNGESGGSPEVIPPASFPFSNVKDWNRATGAGVATSLCLLGCGGLQLYGILHTLGFGGVDGYGFQPWPWWGYQVGCRLCEAGVCLGLSVIGTHPLLCHSNSSIKTLTNPRPGSWSRLSCSSPVRGLSQPAQDGANSPGLSSHESWSQKKQEKLVACDVVTRKHSEALPLCSIVDPPANGVDSVHKHSQTHGALPPSIASSSPNTSKTTAEPQQLSMDSLGVESYSTGDLRPPSPIDLSRSIDQALFSESLFSHSIFGLPRLPHSSSSVSLNSTSQAASKQEASSVADTFYRTSSCGDVDQDIAMSFTRGSKPLGNLRSPSNPPIPPERWDWKSSVTGSTQGLCSHPKGTGKLRSHSWANRGQTFAQSSLPRAIPNLSHYRRYRTLSLASQDSQGSGRLSGTKHLSESKQLEWDLAVQAEFVSVCRQIDALSVCSDTIEL